MISSNKKHRNAAAGLFINSWWWQKTKIGLCAIVLFTGIVWSFHYGLSNMNDNSIREPTMAAADQWLKNADNLQFNICRETVTDSNGWFEYFKKDRTALGDFKKRLFKTKSGDSNASWLTYEIFLNKEKTPPLTEKINLSRNKNGKYIISGVEYSYPRGIQVLKGLPYAGPDSEIIKQKAGACTLNFDSANIGYFETMVRQNDDVQNKGLPQRIYTERQKRGRPVEREFSRLLSGDKVPGMAAFDHAVLINKVTYKIKNKLQTAFEYVLLRKDNLAEKPEWYIYFFNPGPLVKDKNNEKSNK